MKDQSPGWKAYREFVKSNWLGMLSVSSAIGFILTGIFLFTHQLPLVSNHILRTLAINLTFSYSISFCVFFIGSIYNLLPTDWKPFHRHLVGTALVFFGILLGSLVASAFTADWLGLSIRTVMRQVLVFNFFISLVVISLLSVYDRMRNQLREAMDVVRQKELNEQRLLQLKTQAELSSLQAKINPHFLFNALNSIASLIAVDPKSAEQAVTQLSKLLRYSLRSSLTKTVSLSDEIEVVRTYLGLEHMRLADRLHWGVKTTGDVASVRVPGMLLQPLVENAVKHGISSKLQGGCVLVDVAVEDGMCRIRVEDSGVGWNSKSSGGTGHGLANIRERLDLFFAGIYTLEMKDRSEDGGAIVEIMFPLETTCPIGR